MPYGSLVLTASGLDASPLVLLSDLARHTRNFKEDERVSLLFAKHGVEALDLAHIAAQLAFVDVAIDDEVRALGAQPFGMGGRGDRHQGHGARGARQQRAQARSDRFQHPDYPQLIQPTASV